MKNSKKFMWIIIGIIISVLDIRLFVLSGISIETQLIIQIVLWISMIVLSIVDKELRILYLTVLVTSILLYGIIIYMMVSALSKGIMW